MTSFDAARSFMAQSARPLEQSVFDALFNDGDPHRVAVELAPFRNADGGFGRGLEPDKLVPTSQALDVEVAFERLAAVGLRDQELLSGACDWLALIADDRGAVPVLMPDSNEHTRADHWASPSYPPALNPTAAIVGHALALGSDHAWVEQATEYCFRQIESGPLPTMGFDLLAVTKFLAHAPDRKRAAALEPAVAKAIESAEFVKHRADSEEYGVTPLEFAPSPRSLARSWFSDESISSHVGALRSAQQPDGGWPVDWEPPTAESLQAWRGIRTLNAVATLRAYESA